MYLAASTIHLSCGILMVLDVFMMLSFQVFRLFTRIALYIVLINFNYMLHPMFGACPFSFDIKVFEHADCFYVGCLSAGYWNWLCWKGFWAGSQNLFCSYIRGNIYIYMLLGLYKTFLCIIIGNFASTSYIWVPFVPICVRFYLTANELACICFYTL